MAAWWMHANFLRNWFEGMVLVMPYRAVEWFLLRAGFAFISFTHSRTLSTKSFQFSWLASVIARCAPGGLCSLVSVHFLRFWISSAKAIPLIVFEVNEKIGP